MSGVDISEAQAVALEILAQAIRRAGSTPCADDDRWISDSPAVQALAARRCQGCPAFTACDTYAQAHPAEAGVYAGLTEADRRGVKARRPRNQLTDDEKARRRRLTNQRSRRARARRKEAAQAAHTKGTAA